MINSRSKFLNKRGVTLLELMVSVSLFAITIVMASTAFQSVVKSQREAIASQEMQENMRYTFERLGKEIRTAQKDATGSCIPSGRIYWTNGTKLMFLNYRNKCVCYYLDSGRFYVSDKTCESSPNTLPLTPAKITVSNLAFQVTDSNPVTQASVTMKMHINVFLQGTINENIDMQTSLSSRYYE
jgi:prepilin-type N-terminal cleavage/methylation domain-containing protein